MTDIPRDLLAAVDELTKPTTDHVRQYDDDGTSLAIHRCMDGNQEGACSGLALHAVTHPPLLHQLRDAVTPSTGNDAGSKSAIANERNMVDSTALYEYARMAAATGDWCRMTGAPVTRDPVTDLRAWYAAWIGHHDRDDRWYTAELRRWASIIRNHLQPAKRLEVMSACPICGPGPWVDADGETQANRLTLTYRKHEDGTITDKRTICRNPACGAVWEGEDAMVELAEEVSAPTP